MGAWRQLALGGRQVREPEWLRGELVRQLWQVRELEQHRSGMALLRVREEESG